MNKAINIDLRSFHHISPNSAFDFLIGLIEVVLCLVIVSEISKASICSPSTEIFTLKWSRRKCALLGEVVIPEKEMKANKNKIIVLLISHTNSALVYGYPFVFFRKRLFYIFTFHFFFWIPFFLC